MSISSAGLGSGLDVNSIVSQLMAVESIPVNKLQQNKTKIDTDISAFGQLKNYLSAFKDSVSTLKSQTDFINNSSSSSDETILTVSATKDAVAASYNLSITSLAQQHKLRSASFASGSTAVGRGTLTISVGSKSFSVTIDSNNDTLTGIKNAINASTSNTGVTASIVTVDTGSKLVLTADGLGTSNQLTVSVSGDADGNNTDNAGLSQLVFDPATGGVKNLAEVSAAQDAVFSVDGDTVTRSTNSVDDVINGVTVNLVAVGSATISIDRKFGAATTNISKVVSAYNDLTGAIQSLRDQGYSGDALLRNIENNVRNLFSNTPASITGSVQSAIEAGLSFDKDGVLSLDNAQLDKSINNNFNDLVNYFTAPVDGFSNRLESLMNEYVGAGGVIDKKVETLTLQSSGIDKKIEQMNVRLTQIEKRYRDQFTRLDVLMSQFNTTSSYLTSQLEQLSNLNKQIAKG